MKAEKQKNNYKINFSKEAIEKQITSHVVQNPVSIYPISLGGIILAAALSPLLANPLFLLSGIAFLGFGALSMLINGVFRRESIEYRIVNLLTGKLEKQNEQIVLGLKTKLEKYEKDSSMKVYAQQAVEQFEMVRNRFDSFRNILNEKFNVNEITYGRLLGTTEQLYLSVLDNLTKITYLFETLINIDDDYIKERFKYLTNLSHPADADKREIETLKKRKDFKTEKLKEVNVLLTVNEEIMTQIMESMGAIIEAQTKPGMATMEMEDARNELEKLIERTKRFRI